MSGFAKLIPAFTAQIAIDTPVSLGPTARGGSLQHVTIQPGGRFHSELDYPVQIDATLVHGSDFLRADPSGQHVRLDVDGLLRDKRTGEHVRISYTGVMSMQGTGAAKILTGAADAKTTEFGELFIHGTFETGSKELAPMQEKVYVAAGRFVLETGKPVTVEYKFSEVAV